MAIKEGKEGLYDEAAKRTSQLYLNVLEKEKYLKAHTSLECQSRCISDKNDPRDQP